MMRTPIREKLANLCQPLVQATPRKGFTKAQRRAVYEEFNGLCGCGCEEPLAGERWEIDHAIELEFGGAHDLSNWVPMLAGHHRRKTSANAPKVAKVRRIVKRESQGPKPSKFRSGRKLQSPGFRRDITRNMRGQIVRRRVEA